MNELGVTVFIITSFLILYAFIIARSGVFKKVLHILFRDSLAESFEAHINEQLKQIKELEKQMEEKQKKAQMKVDEYYSYNNAKKFFYD